MYVVDRIWIGWTGRMLSRCVPWNWINMGTYHHHHHPSHHQNHLLYQVRALDEGGSLKLEPADLAVGSTFDASSSYRKYILADQDSSWPIGISKAHSRNAFWDSPAELTFIAGTSRLLKTPQAAWQQRRQRFFLSNQKEIIWVNPVEFPGNKRNNFR